MLNIAMKETPGLFHKQPRGGVRAPPWCVLGLVARGALSYFCIAQKVTKMLVAQKTRLMRGSIAWGPFLLARLFAFHILFLDHDLIS